MTGQSVSFGSAKPESKEVVLTNAAAQKVRALKETESNDNLKLRVYITGGGCSGFQYGFKFDEEVKEDDLVIENSDVTMLIDSMSLRYLDGAEVDYESGLEGERFFISNPNAKTTCGCGSSFSV